MGFGFRKFWNGITIKPKTTSTVTTQGDMDVTSTNGKINYHNGSSSSPIVTEAHSATLTNKTISGASNTITNIDAANIANGSVSNTEFQYLDGVTSNIQTQINGLSTGTGTASNLGTGEGVFAQKVGTDFQFKSISGSGSINVTSDADEVTIDATIPASANPSLSNLTSPTSINQNLLPDADATRSLGSNGEAYLDVYTYRLKNSAGNTIINLGSEAILTSSGSTSIDTGARWLYNSSDQQILNWAGTDPSLNSHKLTNVADPTAAQDAATKNYVDSRTPAKVHCYYKTIASQSIAPNFNLTAISFQDQVVDTHSAYNTGTGIFTVPVTGYYNFAISINYSSQSWSSGNEFTIEIGVNPTTVRAQTYSIINATGTFSFSPHPLIITAFPLNAGDIVQISARQSNTSGRSLSSDGTLNYLTISQV